MTKTAFLFENLACKVIAPVKSSGAKNICTKSTKAAVVRSDSHHCRRASQQRSSPAAQQRSSPAAQQRSSPAAQPRLPLSPAPADIRHPATQTSADLQHCCNVR